MEIALTQFVVFLLVFVRVTSLIITAPLIGHVSVPLQVKAGLSVFCAYVLFPIIAKQTSTIHTNLGWIGFAALKECAVGLLVGFSLGLLFAGLRYAGELMSFSMGLSVTNVFDPESGQNTPVVGEFMYLSTVLLFLVLNGHHFVFESLAATFKTIPLGGAEMNESLFRIVMNCSGMMFVVAVKVAAPVTVAVFLANVAMSILARVMPQANIFMLGFPITIGVGFIVLISASPFLVLVFKKLLAEFEVNIVDLVKAL